MLAPLRHFADNRDRLQHRNIGHFGWDRVRRVDPDPDATSPIVIEETDSSLFKCRLDAHEGRDIATVGLSSQFTGDSFPGLAI